MRHAIYERRPHVARADVSALIIFDADRRHRRYDDLMRATSAKIGFRDDRFRHG